MKPLEDALAPPADDWLSFLAVPSTSSRGLQWREDACRGGNRGEADQVRQAAKRRKASPAAGVAAALAGLLTFGRAKLGWFNTTKRKIVGAVGGIALLAAVAGLASLPFLLSHPKPAPQMAVQPKPEEKKTAGRRGRGPPARQVRGEKAGCIQGSAREKDPGWENRGSQEAETSLRKAAEDRTAEAGRTDKPAPKPETRPTPAATKPDANSTAKPSVKPALPEKKPEPPAKPPERPSRSRWTACTDGVDLPQPGKGANEAVSLGKLDLDPKLTLDLQLLGGDTVAKGNPKFELQKDGDGATPGWSVQMAEKNKDAVKIARVWQEESEWKIQWAAEAKDKATLLRYCGLQFSCEKKTHLVALSTPKTVPPLLIDVDTGAVRAD